MRDPLDSMDLIAAGYEDPLHSMNFIAVGYEGSTAQHELNCSGL